MIRRKKGDDKEDACNTNKPIWESFFSSSPLPSLLRNCPFPLSSSLPPLSGVLPAIRSIGYDDNKQERQWHQAAHPSPPLSLHPSLLPMKSFFSSFLRFATFMPIGNKPFQKTSSLEDPPFLPPFPPFPFSFSQGLYPLPPSFSSFRLLHAGRIYHVL